MRYLTAWLAGVVLLHALLTAPLLVQCLPADGQSLIEFLGQDPCHGSDLAVCQTSSPISDPSALADAQGLLDPCLDLALPAADCSLVSVSLPIRLYSAAVFTPPPSAGATAAPSRLADGWARQRHLPEVPDPRPPLKLRI